MPNKPIYQYSTGKGLANNRDNGLREGVGEYSAEYSPYSRNKPFTPISPVPYGRYLALFYIYRLDPTLAYTRHSHPSVFTPRGIITGSGHDTAQPRTTTPRLIFPLVISTLGDSLRADPRIPEI